MNTADKELFEYFYDLNGILDYKSEGNLCEALYQSCHKSLENNLFSDINIQNDKGHTLLHILLHYTKGKALAMKYTDILLSKGANPLIDNNNGQNCFQYASRDNLNEIWRGFDNLSINDSFTKRTQGFHKPFKQFLLNQYYKYNASYRTTEDITQFLKDNELYNHSNIAKLLSTNVSLSIKETIPFFQSLTNLPEDNTIFLKELLCFSGIDVSLTRKDNLALFQDFVNNSQFSIDHNFLDMLINHKINNVTGNTNSWRDQLFNYFTELVVQSDTDLHIKYNISNTTVNFVEHFQHSSLGSYFFSLKLNKELPHKEDNLRKNKI